MPARPDRLNHFLFNSDFPTDKVICLYEGQGTSPSEVWDFNDVRVDLPAILGSDDMLFVRGVWSIDNWKTSHMLGVTYLGITSTPDKYIDASLGWNGYNSETQETPALLVTLQTTGDAGKNKVVKFRVWAVQREDVMNVDYAMNSSTAKNKLLFNTDNNYPRLIKDGIVPGGSVIQHNLGRIPYVDYWILSYDEQAPVSERWYYYPWGDISTTPEVSDYVRATENELYFGNDYFGTSYYYYRIYG